MDLGIGGLGFATEIGAGASAIVYKARQLDLDREVAVKVLKVTDEAFIRRFKREAKTLGKLSQNPGIVTVYDTGVTTAGQPYLILELCESSVLDHLNSVGTFEVVAACHAAAQVADAVANAHDNGVVHRDLKPGNVLLSQTGRYMVTDFGISTVTGATMGQTNSVGFTAGYVAPETLTGEAVGAPSDVYALGATLFHMLAGQAPFVDPDQNSNLLALAQRVVKDPIPDLRLQGIPPQICEVVEAAMAKSPDQRPTAEELRDRLLAIAGTPAPVVTNSTNNIPIDAAAGFATGLDPVTVAVNEADLNQHDATQDSGVDSTVGMTVSQPAAPVQQYGDPYSEPIGGGQGGAPLAPAASSPLERGILSHLPAEPLPPGQTPDERRYQYTSDDRRQLGPLLVGALVGLIALVGVGAFLISRSGPEESATGGIGDGIETVDGPGTSIDGSGNESTGQGDRGDRGLLGPGLTDDSTTTTALGVARVSVPNVTGETATLAESRLAAFGFEVNLVDEESSTAAVGSVIRQLPAPGAAADQGSVVSIYVSTREPVETLLVPSVSGQSEAEAIATLTDADLTVSITRELSLTVAKDDVIGTSPESGTTVNAETNVALIISDGPPVCATYEGGTEAAARTALEALGLAVTSSPASSSAVAEGLVVTCSLTPTTATLTISTGPNPCTALIGTDHVAATTTLEGLNLTVTETGVASDAVGIGEVVTCVITGTSAAVTWAESALPTACPAVADKTVAEATTLLQAAGFTDIEQALVASPDVGAGNVVSCAVSGSTATLTVSSGPADVAVPDVAGMTIPAAATELVTAGLRRATPNEQVESNLPAGQIVGTRPAAGALVPPDTAVTLLISNGGTVMVAVPSVTGLTQAAAEQAIEAVNLVPNPKTTVVADADLIGLVILVAPVEGRMVLEGTTVTIAIGIAAPPDP